MLMTALTGLYFLIRAFYSDVSALARQDLFLIASSLMLYGILAQLMPSRVLRRYISVAFVMLMLLNILTLIPALNNLRDSNLDFAKGDTNTGLFNHKNFFGNFMALMTCFTLSYTLFGECKKWLRVSAFILSILGVVAVIVSASRGSYLALIAGVSVIILCWFIKSNSKNNWINKRMIRVVSIVAILFIAVGGYFSGKHILDTRGTTLSESNSRIYYFAVTLEQIPDALFVGSGSRSVEYKSYENWSPQLSNHLLDFKFTHNEYLQTVADYGLVGFILLFGILCWHLVTGFRVYLLSLVTGNQRNTFYVVAGVSILIASSVHMLLSFPAHGYVNLLLMIVAATWCLGRVNESERSEKQSKLLKINSFAWAGVITCCVLYTFAEGGKELKATSHFWQNGIIVDDKSWNPDEVDTERWSSTLEKVVTVSPTFDRYNKLGVLYLRSKEVSKAISCFEKSKELHPFDPISRLNLADIYSEQQEFHKAEKEYLECEYMVKNREPYFMFYKRLAEFYNLWSLADVSNAGDHLLKARKACSQSLGKSNGYLHKGLRRTTVRTLLLSYYEMMRQKEYDLAYSYFDELVVICKSTHIVTEDDANEVLQIAREMIKHATFVWRRGELQRAAEILYKAKQSYHRYYGVMKGKEDKAWHVEDKKIDEARSILMQAGISIDKK